MGGSAQIRQRDAGWLKHVNSVIDGLFGLVTRDAVVASVRSTWNSGCRSAFVRTA